MPQPALEKDVYKIRKCVLMVVVKLLLMVVTLVLMVMLVMVEVVVTPVCAGRSGRAQATR